MTDSAPIATEILSLAARNIECAVPDARAVSVYVWLGEQPDPMLSLLPEGVEVPSAAHDARRDGGSVVQPVGPDAVDARHAAAADAATVLVAVPLPDVDAVVIGWYDASPAADQVADLVEGAEAVVMAVEQARKLEGTVVVSESRLVIEQAKGMVMGEHRLPADQAFSVLRAVSQESNIPLRDVASSIVDSVNKRATA